MKLNDATIRSLKPTGKQVMYRDNVVPGFGVRITPKGTKSFALMHGPNRTITTLGRYGIVSLADARDAARRILAQKTLGTFQARSIRFSDALDEFVRTHCAAIKTGREYERLLRKEFLPSLQSKTLDKITPHDLFGILDNLSPSVAYHAFTYVKAFFNWTIQRSYLDDSPLRKMKAPKKPPSRSRVLSDLELKAVWRAAAQCGAYGKLVKLLILTGQRRGEIAALQSAWIEHDVIKFPKDVTKNGRDHAIPIGTQCRAVLPRGNLLFQARCARLQFGGWAKRKAELDRLCGVKKWTLHDLRRTYRTIHARIGTPPHIAERLINHVGSRDPIIDVYDLYNYMPEMRKAIEAYDKELTKILE